jgi:hypothetical protein
LEEIIFENFDISENNIISVELAKVHTRVCMCVHCVENIFAENPLFHFLLGFKFQLCHSHAYNFIGLAYQGKDIVFRFIIEYSSFRDFYRPLDSNNNRSIFMSGFLKDDILACLET